MRRPKSMSHFQVKDKSVFTSSFFSFSPFFPKETGKKLNGNQWISEIKNWIYDLIIRVLLIRLPAYNLLYHLIVISTNNRKIGGNWGIEMASLEIGSQWSSNNSDFSSMNRSRKSISMDKQHLIERKPLKENSLRQTNKNRIWKLQGDDFVLPIVVAIPEHCTLYFNPHLLQKSVRQ